MNLLSNIKNFLYDQRYFVSFFDNSLYLYGYEKILKFARSEIIVQFSGFKISIKGDELSVKRMLSNEVLISGLIDMVNIYDRKETMDQNEMYK